VDDDNAVLCLGVVVAVILACVGFIIVLVALGVRRIRNAGRHSRRRCAAAAADMAGVGDDKQEMEWDNSALTITVNPMDQQVATCRPASAAFLTILYALCLSGPSFCWTTICSCVCGADSRRVLEILFDKDVNIPDTRAYIVSCPNNDRHYWPTVSACFILCLAVFQFLCIAYRCVF